VFLQVVFFKLLFYLHRIGNCFSGQIVTEVAGSYLSCVHISSLLCDNIFCLMKGMLRDFPSVFREKWVLCSGKLDRSAGRVWKICIGSEA
jgi:hypothetical protein